MMEAKDPSYSFEQLARALNALNENPGRSIRATSRKFGIPEGTLRYHLRDVNRANNFGTTRRRLLTEAEEDVIIKYVKDCRQRAEPVTKENIMDTLSHAFGRNNRGLSTEAEEELMDKLVKDCQVRDLPATKGNIMDMLNDMLEKSCVLD